MDYPKRHQDLSSEYIEFLDAQEQDPDLETEKKRKLPIQELPSIEEISKELENKLQLMARAAELNQNSLSVNRPKKVVRGLVNSFLRVGFTTLSSVVDKSKKIHESTGNILAKMWEKYIIERDEPGKRVSFPTVVEEISGAENEKLPITDQLSMLISSLALIADEMRDPDSVFVDNNWEGIDSTLIKNVFNEYVDVDSKTKQDKIHSKKSKNYEITVWVGGVPFIIDMLGFKNKDGQKVPAIISPVEVKAKLIAIMEDRYSTYKDAKTGEEVESYSNLDFLGRLNSDLTRTEWLQVKNDLGKNNPEFLEVIDRINDSMFSVSLDFSTSSHELGVEIPEEEISREDALSNIINESWTATENRYNQIPQIVAGEHGVALLVNHIGLDGGDATRLVQMMEGLAQEEVKHYQQELKNLPHKEVEAQEIDQLLKIESTDYPSAAQLKQLSEQATELSLGAAEKDIRTESRVGIFEISKENSDLLKKLDIRPDAFMQLLIAVSLYNFYGEYIPSVEAVSMQGFDKGRVEPVSTITSELIDLLSFIKDNQNFEDLDFHEFAKLFTKATDAHSKLTDGYKPGAKDPSVPLSTAIMARASNISDTILSTIDQEKIFNFLSRDVSSVVTPTAVTSSGKKPFATHVSRKDKTDSNSDGSLGIAYSQVGLESGGKQITVTVEATQEKVEDLYGGNQDLLDRKLEIIDDIHKKFLSELEQIIDKETIVKRMETVYKNLPVEEQAQELKEIWDKYIKDIESVVSTFFDLVRSQGIELNTNPIEDLFDVHENNLNNLTINVDNLSPISDLHKSFVDEIAKVWNTSYDPAIKSQLTLKILGEEGESRNLIDQFKIEAQRIMSLLTLATTEQN